MDVIHVYVSTYCLHTLHGQCRLECKICQAPCRCPCHDPAGVHDDADPA